MTPPRKITNEHALAAAAIGNVLLTDVQRLIELHGDINSLTLMRALKIPYATALDAITEFEINGTIKRKRNGRYRLNIR
jgi:hypothetical protein